MGKCFADKDSYCSALLKKNCKSCNFFRTEENLEKSKHRAMKRIDSLPEETKEHIYDKYFKGE